MPATVFEFININFISGYNSDVICLQEVDAKVFAGDLSTALDLLGFDGAFKEKDGEVREGSAIFYRRSKFKYVQRKCSELILQISENIKA